MKSVSAPISLAGSRLDETRHVCAFFNNDEEEYRILLPFIKDGLKSGDKAVHVRSHVDDVIEFESRVNLYGFGTTTQSSALTISVVLEVTR